MPYGFGRRRQLIGYSRLDCRPSGAARRRCPTISGGLPAIRSARPSWAGTSAPRQRDVRCPLAGHARSATGRAAGAAGTAGAPRRARRAARSSAPPAAPAPPWPGRTTAARRSGTGTAAARQRASSASTAGSIRSATVSVACGRLGRRQAGDPRVAQVVPDLPNRRLGVRVEDQLDGVHHQPTKLATHGGSNADALIDSNSAALSAPAPAGSTARTGAIAESASRLPASTVPGSRGHAPITRPAHQTFCEASASSVSAVWFSVPSPALTTTSTGAAEIEREIAQRRAVRPDLDEQTARTLNQRQPPRPVHLGDRRSELTARGQRHPGPLRRRDWSQRLGKACEPVQFGDARQPPDVGEVVVAAGAAGLDRFAHRDVDSGQPRMTRQRRGGHRLADAGVGASDDENAHAPC